MLLVQTDGERENRTSIVIQTAQTLASLASLTSLTSLTSLWTNSNKRPLHFFSRLHSVHSPVFRGRSRATSPESVTPFFHAQAPAAARRATAATAAAPAHR